MKCTKHTAFPKGYLDFHKWADEKQRTHNQIKCPDCGLYAIWVPKISAAEQRRAAHSVTVSG